MKRKTLLHYPPWVNSKHRCIGDVRYLKHPKDKSWTKTFFDGKRWIDEEHAPVHLLKKSELRQAQLQHNQIVRKS